MRFIHTIFLPVHSTSVRDTTQRFLQLLVGLALYGLSLALMIRGCIGLSPWDVLAVGAAHHVPLSFGAVVVLISVIVLLLWIPLQQKVGVGTVLDTLLVGPAADLFLSVVPPAPNGAMGAPLFLAGLVLIAFATGVYISSDFGPGPRDGLMTGLVRITGGKLWIVRTGIEGTILLIGWLLGGPVGIGTVVFAFGVGPLIGWFLPMMTRASQTRKVASSGGIRWMRRSRYAQKRNLAASD